jgi:hypothetical protein
MVSGVHGPTKGDLHQSSFLEMRDRWGLSAVLSLSCRSFSVSSSALGSVKKRMPPKKAQVQEKKVLLGRPSNNLKIGIVGASLRLSLSSTSNFLQDFQMSGNRLSSMSSPRQASSHHRPTPQSVDSFFFPLVDLGKAANFPYATIDPEVRQLAFSSWSTVEIYAIGSPYTCPGSAI